MADQALQATQAGVQGQFSKAFADLARREQAANAAINMLPGQVTSIYDRGQGAMTGAMNSLDAAQRSSGLASFMPAQAQMAPINSAMSMDRTARQADVPLLRIGTQDSFARTRGALEAAQAEAAQEAAARNAELAVRREALAQERINSDREFALAREKWEWAKAHPDAQSDPLALMQAEMELKDAYAQRSEKRQQAAAKQSIAADRLGKFSPTDTSAERGAEIAAVGRDLYANMDKITKAARAAYAKSREGHRRPGVLHNPLNRNFSRDDQGIKRALERRGQYRTAALFQYLIDTDDH